MIKFNSLTTNDDLKELKKSNEAIELCVKTGYFSLLSRKVFNVLVYHAQKLKIPGLNSPIKNEANKKYFWIPFIELARDTGYQSNDTKKLKNHLQKLVNIQIVTENFSQWTSQNLISAFTLVNSLGLRRKGGQLWLGFTFPPEVEAAIMHPDSYTKLTFLYQSKFRSGASLALYEICRRYLTNPSKLSTRNSWQWWYQVLTGHSIEQNIPEYKITKRDTFKKAISEVNLVTDITIELLEYRQGRKIIDLQFKVFKSSKTKLNFLIPSITDATILKKLIGFGMTQKEASSICASTEKTKLLATITLVEKRIAKKNIIPIHSITAYLKQGLKENWAASGIFTK